jgi:hypothetical protein
MNALPPLALALAPQAQAPLAAAWQAKDNAQHAKLRQRVVVGRVVQVAPATTQPTVVVGDRYQRSPGLQALLPADQAVAPGADLLLASPPDSKSWLAKVKGAVDELRRKQARLGELLAASAAAQTPFQVIADPVPAPVDATAMSFAPLPGAPRFLFFNHRETIYPYELGGAWREIQRAPGGLKLDAAAPARFSVGAEHADAGGYGMQLGLRFKNLGKTPLKIEFSNFQWKDQGYGAWAKREALDVHLGNGGKQIVTIAPAGRLDLPVMRVKDQAMGAYQLEARVLTGKAGDLQVAELGRFDAPAHGDAQVLDPWQQPVVGGTLPRLPIFLDNGARVGLPSYFKTHQEFIGRAVQSPVMPLAAKTTLKIEAHNFGVASSDDFPGRDRGYGYHIDHLARFTFPEGVPKALRFSAPDGGVTLQLSQQMLTMPNGEQVKLTHESPSADVPVDYLLSKGWLTQDAHGVFSLAISFPNGANAHVWLAPVYGAPSAAGASVASTQAP